MTVPQLKWLYTSSLLWTSRMNSRAVYVRCVVDKMVLRKVSFQLLWLFSANYHSTNAYHSSCEVCGRCDLPAYHKFCSLLGPSGTCLFSGWGNICEIWGSDGGDYDVYIFWDVISWSLVDTNFSGEYAASTNRTEEWEASSSRMLANMYHTTKRHNPEDSLFIVYIQKVYIFSSEASWFSWVYLMTHSKAKFKSCVNKPFHFSEEMNENETQNKFQVPKQYSV
jgi:hypothetical protein